MQADDIESSTDPTPGRSARGLSRRQMIKASAIAGAAAWTAPVIIDSLTSPAAAYSGTCNKYSVKLLPATSVTAAAPTSYNACFGGTVNSFCFPASTTKWGGSLNAPTANCNPPGSGGSGVINDCTNGNCGGPGNGPVFCPSGNSNKLSTMTIQLETLNSVVYQKVDMNGTCGFRGGATGTDWQIGGRYGPGSPGSSFLKPSVVCPSASGPASGSDGCYWPATDTAWVRQSYTTGSGSSTVTHNLNYVYVQFCCNS